MSSVRSVTVVPAGLDPFARRRTVTNPVTGQSIAVAPLVGPTTVTVPLGPPGRPGASGAGGARYQYVQSAPSATWPITHNLGHRPIVALFDTAGREMTSDVEHPDLNTTVVTYAAPTAGTAELV